MFWKRKSESKELVVAKPIRERLSENAIIEAFDMLGITADLDAPQKKLFVAVAYQMQLNPLKREIHAVSIWNSRAGKKVLTPVVGYEVYIKRAEATGRLEYWKVDDSGTVVQGDIQASDYKVTLIVKRRDRPETFTWVARYAECVGMTDRGPNSMWKKRPYFMTQKCAIGQGFRLAFPDILLDMPYVDAEIEGQAEVLDEEQLITEPQPIEGVIVDTEGKVLDEPDPEEEATAAKEAALKKAEIDTAKTELNAVYHMIKKPVGDGPPLFTKKEIAEMVEEAKKAEDDVKLLQALTVSWSEQFAERAESAIPSEGKE